MTEFKQIVGRGTRVHEDTKKYYFTLIDFRGATDHFADEEFDGPPIQIYEPGPDQPITPPDEAQPDPRANEDDPGEFGHKPEVLIDPPDITIKPDEVTPRLKIYVDGVDVEIVAERVEYLDESGKLIAESLRDFTKKTLRKRFASLNDFLTRWNAADRKQAIIDELAADGLPFEPIADELARDLDPFDVICHVAFDQPPLTRRERANMVRKRDVFTKYGEQARAVLDALLQKYQDQGVTNLDDVNLLKVAPFSQMGMPMQLLRPFGGHAGFQKAVHEMQSALYQTAA
jgi:type I restriction enzyme R subunit